MEAARHQGPAVIATLVGNRQRFLSFLIRRVDNPADAEEILQAAFVKSVEKADSLRAGETVVAWFYRLLRNAVIDHYRHQDAERRALERFDAMSEDSEAPEADLERAVCQCVHDVLPTLKDDYATLLKRIDLEDASISEVAMETGMTANNTRVKLHRARTALRKQLQLCCGSCAEHGCLDCTCQRHG
ncbi:MAG: RNA polymerase sigma factor [Planctomycetota bacterium]|jgi:RNA polymerase sigma-70 factor (ECF subfamily)